jgi:hypothetical protein
MEPADLFASTEEVEVDEETLAAIDRGIKAADEAALFLSKRFER